MKKLITASSFALLLAGIFAGCKKNSAPEADLSAITQEEKSLVAAAGFNSNWVERAANGSYLIENDILLTKAQLSEMAGNNPSHNLIVADEEQYRTYNLVSTPSTGSRTITVQLNGTFPSYYSTALDKALSDYNSFGLKITFLRVSSNGNIVITGSDLGTSGGGCILGQSAGFPDANGNPAPGFKLSTSSCATTYINTEEKAKEVIAHELGHTIGFRHTDYKRRQSCGPGPGESAGSIGAVHIPGTPDSNVSSSYDSWMMACTNGKGNFNGDDVIALQYIY